MTTVGKLTKLKSAIKRFPSFSRFNRTATGLNLENDNKGGTNSNNNKVVSVGSDDDVVLRAVFVGKSRRRYLVRSEVVEHPLFQELVGGGGGGGDDVTVADCEVVMFEHLLWMIHNAEAGQLVGPTDELAQFYTC